jgi:putative membrane protein
MDATQTRPSRAPLAAIGAVSLAAIAFLFWLIYFREGAGTTDPNAVTFLPAVNASLNALSATCLVLGYRAIRRGARDVHQRFMQGAFAFSSLFLVSYIVYHSLHGDTPFPGQGAIRPVYFFILISHIVLSVVALPLVLSTFYLSWSGQLVRHKKLARWTLPLWLYVSVTGVVIFALLRAYT